MSKRTRRPMSKFFDEIAEESKKQPTPAHPCTLKKFLATQEDAAEIVSVIKDRLIASVPVVRQALRSRGFVGSPSVVARHRSGHCLKCGSK